MKINKDDIIALILSIVIHVLLFLFLYFGVFKRVIPIRDDGIFVDFGDFVEATGEFEPQMAVTAQQIVDKTPVPPKPKPVANEEMVTQDEEETVHLPNTKKKKEKLAESKPVKKPKQQTEEERKKEEQKKREEEQKRQEGNISNTVSSAFNRSNTKGSAQGNAESGESEVSGFADNSINSSTGQGSDKSGKGNQGSPFGNADSGPKQGVGGYGNFSLSGRTLRDGKLPRPAFDVEDYGKIVIKIVVDNNGNVISTEIGQGTTVDNAALRREALSAAKKAKFNKINGLNNQNGTITYIFDLH